MATIRTCAVSMQSSKHERELNENVEYQAVAGIVGVTRVVAGRRGLLACADLREARRERAGSLQGSTSGNRAWHLRTGYVEDCATVGAGLARRMVDRLQRPYAQRPGTSGARGEPEPQGCGGAREGIAGDQPDGTGRVVPDPRCGFRSDAREALFGCAVPAGQRKRTVADAVACAGKRIV